MHISRKNISFLGFVILTFIVSCTASPESKLRQYLNGNNLCSQENLKIKQLEPGFLVEGCGQNLAYIQCGCCDNTWFQQCKPPNDKEWLKYCDPEIRSCFEDCMVARKAAGFEDFSDVKTICKEFDNRYLIDE